MAEGDTDFEDESFDEESEPFPDSFALTIATEWPHHCDGQLSGSSITHRAWIFTPKPLKKLVAQAVVSSSGKYKLQSQGLPHHLYPLVLSEAARLKNDEAVWYLISTWPYDVLNFNEIEMPLESHMGFLTRGKSETAPLSDSIIRGLFYRSRMKCRLKMIILPKDVSEAAEVLKTFLRIPIQYLRDLPDVNTDELLKRASYSEGEKYLKTVPQLELKRPISYAAYRKDKLRLVIVLPSVVVHFLGMKQNYDDVIVGLILQRHSPFLFHFDNLAICNFPNSRFVGAILDRLVNPEGLRKLILLNKYFYKTEHVMSLLVQLNPVLQRLTGIRGFSSRLCSVLGFSQTKAIDQGNSNASLHMALRNWKRLDKLSVCEQPLLGHLKTILTAVTTSLVKLSLVAVQLSESDVLALCQTRHVRTIVTLQLDQNDLHSCISAVQELLLHMCSLCVLQLRHCLLTVDDCLSLASTLRSSTAVRSWTVANNQLNCLADLKLFLASCSKIVTLKEVGCCPAEYQCVFGQLIISKFRLTEEEKDSLVKFAENLGLDLM